MVVLVRLHWRRRGVGLPPQWESMGRTTLILLPLFTSLPLHKRLAGKVEPHEHAHTHPRDARNTIRERGRGNAMAER